MHVLFEPEPGPVSLTWNIDDIVPYYEASSLEQNIIIITASIPTLGPLLRYVRHRFSTATSTSTDTSRRRSGDSAEIQYNLAQALGIRMPGLGNTVIITAGPLARDNNSEEHILPLSAIKATTRTNVRVEYTNPEEVESSEELPPTRTSTKL
jgi:hypothetical protein